MGALIPDREEFVQSIVNEAIQCLERLEQGGRSADSRPCPLRPLYARRPAGFNLCSVVTRTGRGSCIKRKPSIKPERRAAFPPISGAPVVDPQNSPLSSQHDDKATSSEQGVARSLSRSSIPELALGVWRKKRPSIPPESSAGRFQGRSPASFTRAVYCPAYHA